MSAGYDPLLPGLDEARLDGYRELIVSKIALLNTALCRDGLRDIGEITCAMVEIGDSEVAWGLASGPVRIRIVAGGDEDGMDFQAKLGMGLTGCTGYVYDFTTNIYVYLHPDALANEDSARQAEDRERARTVGACQARVQAGGLTPSNSDRNYSKGICIELTHVYTIS